MANILDKFNAFSGVPLDVLNSQLSEQRKFLVQLQAEIKVLEADVRGFQCEGYEFFKKEVLGREKPRLLEKRMTIDASEINLHREIQAQWNEAELLSHTKEYLEREIDIKNKKMLDISEKISKVSMQINKSIKKEK